MSSIIRVAIVEDHSGFRETLCQIFADTPDFRVPIACPNAESALVQIPKTGCDLVLLDINLPKQSGIDCLRALKEQMPHVRMVMLTAYDDNDSLFQSLLAGADGYLLKRTPRDRLLTSLRDIVAGGAPISPQVARRMVEYFHNLKGQKLATTTPVNPDMQDLTAREKEVLGLLASGNTPKEVAAKLDISWQTVRNHIRFIYDKLHVHTRTDAVLKYIGRDSTTERGVKSHRS
jgi:DNA-binding NarL/FixJ family response regulator